MPIFLVAYSAAQFRVIIGLISWMILGLSLIHIYHKSVLRILIITLTIFMLLLSGCHFPGYTPSTFPKSDQRKTEIAAILNPTLLTSPTPTITPLPNLPIPDATVAHSEDLADGANYTTRQGDTLVAIASRFDVPVESIVTNSVLSPQELLPVGLRLFVPEELEDLLPYHAPIFPDSEVIYSPSAVSYTHLDVYKRQGLRRGRDARC